MPDAPTTPPPAAPAAPSEAAPAAPAAPATPASIEAKISPPPAAPEAKAPEAPADLLTGEEAKPEAAEGEKAEAAAADVVVTLPEGMEADAALLEGFTAAAKAQGLKSEQAQALVDVFVKQQQADAEAADVKWKQTQADWQAQLAADKDVGGPAFKANLQLANKALAKFAGPELVQVLKATGLSNHPGFVKFAVSVGKAMADDSVRGGRAAAPGAATDEETRLGILYPTMTKK